MKLLKIAAVVLAASLAAGSSAAQVLSLEVPANLPIPKSTLTRAEVVAELLIWRAAGLYDLHNSGDTTPDPDSSEYKLAQAKYDYLHASPQFAALVEQIRRDRSTRIVLAQRR